MANDEIEEKVEGIYAPQNSVGATETLEHIAAEVNIFKNDLSSTLAELCLRYGLIWKETPKITTAAKLLSSGPCERQLKYTLEHNGKEYDERNFDRYYGDKSKFATLKILDHLKTRLLAEGFKVELETEVKHKFGRYDVTLVQGNPCRVFHNGVEKIKIEVKASLGLPLEQVDRELWDGFPLILVRVVTGHVTKLLPSELDGFIVFSQQEMLAKADRLLTGSYYTVPGNYCSKCLDIQCPFNRKGKRTGVHLDLVKMANEEFQADIEMFFKNLGYVSKRAAEVVIEELRNGDEKAGVEESRGKPPPQSIVDG